MKKYLFILICLPVFGQVPDTNTFSFTDVKDEIENNGGATTNSLVDAFTNANDAGFDPAYEGSKNALLNFRNYVHSPFFDTGDSYSFSSQTTGAFSIFFKPDGTKVFIGDFSAIYAYTLSIAWDITSITYDGDSFSTSCGGLTFKPDGTKMYAGYSDELKEYTLSTAWDITTASLTYTLDITDSEGDIGVYLHPSGTYIFKLGGNTDNFRRYTMSTAYDLSTATQSQSQSAVGTATAGIFLKPDGTKVFSVDRVNTPRAFESYDLSTAWSITTLNNNIRVSNETLYRDLYIRSNGQDYYVITQTGIHRWLAVNAWEID